MKLFQWLKFLLLFLIFWTFILIYFWSYNSNIENTNYTNVLEKLRNQINELEQQYSNMLEFSNILRELPIINENDAKSGFSGYKSTIEEMLRRRTHTNLKELLYTITAQLKNNPKSVDLYQDLEHRVFSLIADVELISESNISQTWRKLELVKLSKLIQNRLEINQNPDNCVSARKLICNLNKGCGFGCQIHHVLYCLILAYSTERTLILESNTWRYGFKGWDFVFLPLSINCTTYDKSKGLVNWGDQNMNKFENVLVPIIDTISYRPLFLPQAIPIDLYDKLLNLHGDPFVWFSGQLLSYIMRLNSFMTSKLYAFNNGQFSRLRTIGPIVGVHIRRTDKVGTEAQFHSLSEYMFHVESYFRKEEIKINLKSQLDDLVKGTLRKRKSIKLKRQIVLATDEPKIFREMNDNYPHYQVFGNPDNSKTANIGNRYSQEALQAIIIDTAYLSQTNFLVCTFSSQVCRIAYELMQSYILNSPSGDQGNQFRSLDDIYYFGGQHPNSMVMIQDFQDNKSTFTLNTGDKINVMGNHWNGWSKGVSERDNVGLFPTYKAQFIHRIVPMGAYNNFSKHP